MDPVLAPLLELDGATSPEVLRHLFELAQCVRDGCIVEVGSWRGRSTAALALGSQRAYRVPVYAIEPHEEFRGIGGAEFGSADRVVFFQNMLRVGTLDVVRLVNLSSEYVTRSWPMPVGLLWIDGDHRYRGVRNDILCWLPHLRPDATVFFDDATNPLTGPYHVVEEMVRGGRWVRGPEIGKTKTLVRVLDGTIDQSAPFRTPISN
jgi:predicted O-methyltransferase YrrM